MGRDGIFMLATVLATKWEYVWVYGELFIENFLPRVGVGGAPG